MQSATAVLASDQHVFRYDGRTSRTFTACDGTVCGVSPTSGGLEAALARATSDARFDFGSSHFAARLEDSLELKPQTRSVNGITLVEGYGLRSGERAFSARFYGAWLDGSSFGVKPTGSNDYIQGRFVGENHAGVVGIFERSNVVGSFGGNRQPDN